ncbi:MAG: Uma2 family endonuclease [Actinobacteria bacterium]|nr:Uma2 family endonuclease [Actinomycetota bacterium]
MATVVLEQATNESVGRVSASEPVPYEFTAAQALMMVEAGILPDSVELLDGVFYEMVKGELHNVLVTRLATTLRPLIPAGFHVREEKSCRADPKSLPEPDVIVCAGEVFDYLPDPPPLAKLALAVEVSLNSDKSDRVIKFAMYAAAGVPSYWIMDAEGRDVEVWSNPARGADSSARYESLITYKPGQSIPLFIDGRPCGAVQVAELFPPEKQP